ncbi:MAG: hypothetical protein M3032_08890 [Verrucomicrobiota bacterium]|nr:hypothetical protein [Verrucomicrobiota bacterium]
MKGFRSAFLIGLAYCLAATSGFARQTSSHSKSARSEKSSRSSGKKSRGASSKSRKSKATAKSRKKDAHASRTSESERLLGGFSDVPPEDLPEPEDDDANGGDQ